MEEERRNNVLVLPPESYTQVCPGRDDAGDKNYDLLKKFEKLLQRSKNF